MTIRALGVVVMAIVLLAVSYVATVVPTPPAHGRHAVASDRERCVASMGPSFVQFSAYQAGSPQTRYCRQIPEVGPATIVIDQSDAELREMSTDVRIIADVDGGAGAAPMIELSSDAVVAPEALDPVTVKHLPPEVYPTGIIEFAHTFTNPGQYHAMVTAKNDHGQVFISEFPFRVGRSGHAALVIWGVSVAAAIAAAGLLAWKFSVLQRFWPRGGRM